MQLHKHRPIPRLTPITTLKWHLAPIIHFATVHIPDRQTDTLDLRAYSADFVGTKGLGPQYLGPGLNF